MIPFNKIHITGKEIPYIKLAIGRGKLSGNGFFTNKCQEFLEKKYGFNKVLITTSCTSAIEVAALLLNIKRGDEIIAPSFTFVSTVNPFIALGAKIVFADSGKYEPNIDVNKIEELITKKTKAIIVVHYAGVSCDMDKIMKLVEKKGIKVIEDAAQALGSSYLGRPLGSIGHLATFSFHDTKNINSGEGGALIINDKKLIDRAIIIWEKGTNRRDFIEGKVDKYGWVDVGSSSLPSEVMAAFLYAQLENIDEINKKRNNLWGIYYRGLQGIKKIELPFIPRYATHNGHIFYIIVPRLRDELLKYLKSKGIDATFHFLSLHKSKFYEKKHDGRNLSMSEFYANNLIRLPLYYDLKYNEINRVIRIIKQFYENILE